MATLDDLTFNDLATALGPDVNAILVEDLNTGLGEEIFISATAILAEPLVGGLGNKGVVEFMYKLRAACTKAQETANAALDPENDELLTSFPAFSYDPPVNGQVTVTQTQTVKIPLDNATVIGTN